MWSNNLDILNDKKLTLVAHIVMLQVRDKASNINKHGRAGPGTGSMGGRCSVCGDRATKVTIRPFSEESL